MSKESAHAEWAVVAFTIGGKPYRISNKFALPRPGNRSTPGLSLPVGSPSQHVTRDPFAVMQFLIGKDLTLNR